MDKDDKLEKEVRHFQNAITSMEERDDSDSLVCSFCGKRKEDVEALVAGPSVFICDGCVAICNDVIAEQRNTK